jgi:hypothetical protein
MGGKIRLASVNLKAKIQRRQFCVLDGFVLGFVCRLNLHKKRNSRDFTTAAYFAIIHTYLTVELVNSLIVNW